MPDIYVAVDYAILQSGKPYHAYGDRFGPDYYDCSGLVIGSLRHAGITVPSDVGNTVGLYKWAQRVGGLISVQQGVATRGAIMIKGRWYGYGPLGHTSFSLGDGREMAAHGRRRGIGITNLDAGFYQDAFIIPGVDYHLGSAPPSPTPAPTIKERDMVILPGIGAPAGRRRVADLDPSGLFIRVWNGGRVADLDGHRDGDDDDMRRCYPRNADGTHAPTAALPLDGLELTDNLKFLVAKRKDGSTYDIAVFE